jgi:hypothetical protein
VPLLYDEGASQADSRVIGASLACFAESSLPVAVRKVFISAAVIAALIKTFKKVYHVPGPGSNVGLLIQRGQ